MAGNGSERESSETQPMGSARGCLEDGILVDHMFDRVQDSGPYTAWVESRRDLSSISGGSGSVQEHLAARLGPVPPWPFVGIHIGGLVAGVARHMIRCRKIGPGAGAILAPRACCCLLCQQTGPIQQQVEFLTCSFSRPGLRTPVAVTPESEHSRESILIQQPHRVACG